jgi:hypothetical protein
MKKASLRRIELFIFLYCLLLSVLLIVGNTRIKMNFSGDYVQSALLNEKYKAGINKIKINFPDGYEFLFDKKKNISNDYEWMCSAGGITFSADNDTITKMLEVFCTTRNFIQLSDDFSSWNQFDLTDEQAVKVSFYESANGNDTLRSSLFFGRSTSDYSGVYVRNDRKPTVYRVEDNVSSYLTDNANFWADLSVVGENTAQEAEKSFMSVSISEYSDDNENVAKTKKLYNDGSESFTSYIHTLLSLRGSGIVSTKELLLNEPSEGSALSHIATITTEKQDGKSVSVQVFSYAPYTPDETVYTRYFVSNRPNENDTQSYPDYFIEISSWTYRNLLPSSIM